MIRDALKHVVDLLNVYIQPIDPGNADDMVVLRNIALVDAFNDEQADPLQNRIIASVVNVEQDSLLRNMPSTRVVRNAAGELSGETQEAPIILNLYVMFSANNSNYENALFYLSAVIAFFQRQHIFQAPAPAADSIFQAVPSFEKMIFDLYTMSFEEQNQLWGILGGKYIPSVFYKVRLTAIQAADASESSVVRAIQNRANGV